MNTMINFIVTYIIWSIRSPKGFSELSDENANECFSILQVSFVLPNPLLVSSSLFSFI